MKSKTITAIIIAAALVIFSAVLFLNKKQTMQTPFNITGAWTLDSTYAIGHTEDSITLLLSKVFIDQKNKPLLQFNADSTLRGTDIKDSTAEKYYLRDSILYVNEGNGYIPYPVKTMTDTLFEFTNKDSVVFVLKKK